MKNYLLRLVMFFFAIAAALSFATGTFAKVEWEILKNITLDDSPRDITISRDGSTAYILCSKSVQIYSTKENKVTGTMPLKDDFSKIAISPDGGQLYLTKAKGKQVTIIQISQIYDIEIDKSPVIGKADAPVKVFAFLDYQWPYCSRVYPVLEQLLEKYPNDVSLVIKHFPLRMHKFAEKASIAALAASRQNKYQELTKVLLGNYKTLSDETIKKHAEEIGLDMEKFNKAYNDPSLKKHIQQDMRLGGSVQVRGVPAIFINGRIAQQRSIQGFYQMVEQELKKNR